MYKAEDTKYVFFSGSVVLLDDEKFKDTKGV
jgi:hypothetical protein